MELRAAVLVLLASVLTAGVDGQQQCQDQRKCMPFSECREYRSYVGKPSQTWPRHVQTEVKGLFCGTEHARGEKIYKFCCKPAQGAVKPTTTPTLKPPSNKSGLGLLDLKTCGKQSKQRIAHGEIAEVFEYPWMALLGDINGDFHCGGALIAESFILTAAHCNRKKVFIARVGETDRSTPIDCNYAGDEEDCAEPHQDIPVARFIRHQLYSVSQRKNDIALVKLTRPAQLNDNVRPICLPLPELLPRKLPLKMVVSGWGFTEDRAATSNQLRYANIPLVDQTQCQRSLKQLSDANTVDESQVCAGGAKNLADNCEGDSGGPLQYFGKQGYIVHGVVSWGLATCGKERSPGVYTKVSHYMQWIIQNLK